MRFELQHNFFFKTTHDYGQSTYHEIEKKFDIILRFMTVFQYSNLDAMKRI